MAKLECVTRLNRDGRARANDLQNRGSEHGAWKKVLDGRDLRLHEKSLNVDLVRTCQNKDDVEGDKDGRRNEQHGLPRAF